MVTNFASKLMKKFLSEKDLNAKGKRGGKVRREKVRWGENEKVRWGDGGKVGGCINIRKGK